jgi:hypothetical protein
VRADSCSSNPFRCIFAKDRSSAQCALMEPERLLLQVQMLSPNFFDGKEHRTETALYLWYISGAWEQHIRLVGLTPVSRTTFHSERRSNCSGRRHFVLPLSLTLGNAVLTRTRSSKKSWPGSNPFHAVQKIVYRDDLVAPKGESLEAAKQKFLNAGSRINEAGWTVGTILQ